MSIRLTGVRCTVDTTGILVERDGDTLHDCRDTMSGPDPTCRHPKAYVANAAAWDTTLRQPVYQLMMGCVLCSQWQEAPKTWQTGTDALNIGQPDQA